MPHFTKIFAWKTNSDRVAFEVLCVLAIAICSSCSTFRPIDNHHYQKQLWAGDYGLRFKCVVGDSETTPDVGSCYPPKDRELLHKKGSILVTANGRLLQRVDRSSFDADGHAGHIYWHLASFNLQHGGLVDVVIDGEIAELVADRGLEYVRYVK